MPKQPNIIFLMLDTVRADALCSYGGSLRLENIDRLAKKSVVFQNAVAPGTYTLPSHLSIFLGKRPRSIRGLMRDNIKHYNDRTDPFLKKSSYVRGNEITLAKHLSYLGYKTALFSNNPFVSSAAGISNGFSYVENMFVESKLNGGSIPLKVLLKMIDSDVTRNNIVRVACEMSRVFPDGMFDKLYLRLRKKVDRHYSDECMYYSLDSGAEATNRSIGRYLDSEGSAQNFIFANYMEGHEGYPTNLVTDKEIVQDKWLHMIGHNAIEDSNAERMAYQKRIVYLDGKIGSLMKTLRKKGALENSYVIIAGDHGQAFMEHGQMYHNVFPYNEIAKVPLIISRFAGGKQVNLAQRIARPFSLTELNRIIPDIAFGNESKFANYGADVTVCDHLGITEVWDTYLLRLIRARSRHADQVYRKKLHFNTFASAIFYGKYKLIHFYGSRKDELYRIDDRAERSDIIEENRSIAHRIMRYNRLVC